MPASLRTLLGRLQVPMYSASGLRVQYLRVWEKTNSKVDKWIRKVGVFCSTRAGINTSTQCWVAEFCQQCHLTQLFGRLQVCKAGDFSIRT